MRAIVQVVPLYAAIFAFIFVFLSLRTVRLRRELRISIGDSGDERMLRAMRVHSNFAEYVPLSLLLILLVEMQGASHAFIHGLCLVLLAGRLLHAYGVSRSPETYRFRIVGMVLTLATLITSAVVLLLYFARS